MRILLLHNQDEPLHGPWTRERWDAVFDLGRGGWAACERWARAFGCPVQPIDALNQGKFRTRRVRELLEWGRGCLIDGEGIDWWELTALLIHQQLETLVLLKKFADEIAPGADVSITRDGFEARVVRILLGDRLRVVDSRGVPRKGVTHYAERFHRLPVVQILDILGDKYDGAYRLRRHWHRRRARATKPVMLLPTAYVNVSLMGIAYAQLLPEASFLLVTTRRSGRLADTPGNVTQEWLASYACDASREEESELLAQWQGMQKEIGHVEELAMARELGLVEDFPRRFREGLVVRNAWRQVFDRQPVRAVLCGDDSNPYTHIPLLLGRKRGLPTIACHHGAFDGRYQIKINHADLILAKGRMEQDYLVNVCGVDPAVVGIGAPSSPGATETAHTPPLPRRTGESIVFFSEPYEMASGRTEEIYRDILPKLVELAKQVGKKLIVKLHPSESLRDRQILGRKLLRQQEVAMIEWRSGRLTPELLGDTWFGITVTSSVPVECLMHGVPCFVCEWLDLWPYGYVSQFRKFGVGIGLSTPAEIAEIPTILGEWRPDRRVIEDCWQAISQERLRALLSPAGDSRQVAVATRHAE